ncbi:NlpC/P60 family protein [Campylobacter sp. 2018MI10]|uniref:NlpC/P60 family protein n=1 Tax=Campylobacter sp. 2018MI10 TaxID=2836736 RepID=UPI001BD997B2|nr:NlpC/P60 family protein [Campylobacter sp. 2018MI10]MBT0880202.1 C40 family peptidase [Campylobacter sp. 2018MI27]MBT0883981.1 C40 family peptidase [Campylobacter sp. 2018MI10]
MIINRQIFLPIILAIFFVACSQNIANNNYENYQNKINGVVLIDDVYSNYPAQMFTPNAIFDTKLDIEKVQQTNKNVERILNSSSEWRYTPYRLGGTNKNKGADCSFFTQEIYKQVYGFNLSRSTKEQRLGGKKVSKSKLKAGDLVFFRTDGPFGLHVGIYLENNNFIHLSSKGGTRIQSLNVRYWNTRYLDARRYINAK